MSGPAQQIRRTGSFGLPIDADMAFPLFSPEGEREWVRGWDPTPVFPDRIEFRRDTVFREGPAGDVALWTIVDADRERRRAEYVRVAASHTGHIVVIVTAVGAANCRVNVSYTITLLQENPALMQGFSEEGYAAKMRSWQEQINASLKARK